MAIQPSTKISGYLNKYMMQDTKLTDYFYTEYLNDNDTNQFYNMDNVTQDHAGYLKPLVKTMTFTSEEYRKYRYNPWRLSDDLYGTTELWFMLLHINEMFSVNEFNLRTIKVYDKEELLSRMGEIVNVKATFLTDNANAIIAKKKEIEEGIDGMWD